MCVPQNILGVLGDLICKNKYKIYNGLFTLLILQATYAVLHHACMQPALCIQCFALNGIKWEKIDTDYKNVYSHLNCLNVWPAVLIPNWCFLLVFKDLKWQKTYIASIQSILVLPSLPCFLMPSLTLPCCKEILLLTWARKQRDNVYLFNLQVTPSWKGLKIHRSRRLEFKTTGKIIWKTNKQKRLEVL